MAFTISKDRMYHMPHNTALLDEFRFLLDIIDTEKKVYTFKELAKKLLIEQVKKNKFKIFHGNMPYRIFTEDVSPDKNDLIKKLKLVHSRKTRPAGMPDWLYESIMNRGVEEAVNILIDKRKKAYSSFIQNPDEKIEQFLNCQYKPTKTWKQNWVEFVRDYVDFAAYCGLIPCYYKLPGVRTSEDDGYVVTPKLVEYRKGNIDLKEIIMHFKYSNSSINTRRYTQFNIKVRPFYLTLKILAILKEKGIDKVERRLLFGAVTSFKDESELNDCIEYLLNFIGTEGNYLSEKNYDSVVSKEAGRVATGMVPFLKNLNLIELTKEKNLSLFKITKEGEELLKSCAENSLFFGEYIHEIFYSPLLARTLKIFNEFVKSGKNSISLDELKDEVNFSEKEILKEVVGEIIHLKPSPIRRIEKEIISLNDFSHQYAITPFVDFASLKEAEFVLEGAALLKIKKLKKIVLPPKELIAEIKARALSDDGSKYEEIIESAFKKLPGITKRFGQSASFSRLSDVVWLINFPIDGEIKKILTVIETKAGKAIKSFKETKEIEDIKNTVLEYKEIFPDLYGIWVLIIDSDQMPSINRHGGHRGGGRYQVSFKDKLLKIHQSILTSFGKPVLVTGFDVFSFIEYYKYLYTSLSSISGNVVPEQVEQFFMRGNLFFDDYRYIKVINDANVMKSNLFV